MATKKHRTNRVTFNELSKRVDQPDPFEVEVAPDVWITFQDPFDDEYDSEFEMSDKPAEQMRQLLGDKAFEEFEASDVHLTGRQYAALAAMVMDHFRVGEDNAS